MIKHDFTGKLYVVVCPVEGGNVIEQCTTLQQALYRTFVLTRAMEDKKGWITLPCGTVIEWDGHSWFNIDFDGVKVPTVSQMSFGDLLKKLEKNAHFGFYRASEPHITYSICEIEGCSFWLINDITRELLPHDFSVQQMFAKDWILKNE